MINFAQPLALLAIPALGLILWFVFPRQRRQHLLRFVAVAAVIGALSEPQISMRDSQEYLVFLVDRSASVRRTTDIIDVERQLKNVMSDYPTWRFGVVEFAENASAIAPIGEGFSQLSSENKLGDDSRLDKAVDVGLAMMPANGANRLVLVSDGQFHGTTVAGVTSAQLAGVPISVLPIGEELPRDVRLAALIAPSETPSGQPFELAIEISAQEDTQATLAIYRQGDLLSYDAISLVAGTSTYTLDETLSSGGFAEYTAVVKRDFDDFPENDERSALVQTVDKPAVLLVDPTGGTGVPSLLDAIGVSYATATEVPDFTVLSTYKQLILAGQPLNDLTADNTTSIEQFVQNLGGGLLIVQGEDEVRGFNEGPIDELLPVSYTTPEKERDPSLAIVYLLDRSYSMRELVDLRAKIRIVREATAASIFRLPSDALVGLLGFSSDFDWIYPIQRVGDATEIYAALQSLRAYGGTQLFDPLLNAVESLILTPARSKHLLLLSDGKTTDAARDYSPLLGLIAEQDNLTLSVIALGEDPNLSLLGELADAGEGILMQVVDYLALPQATMDIVQRLGNSRFVTGEIEVSGALASDAEYNSLPPLSGYVLTYPRTPTSVLLSSGEDPIAATWRIGLGSVTVLNTDLSGIWSESWLGWPQLSVLFERLLDTTEPLIIASEGLFPSVSLGQDSADFIVDARTPSGGFANFLQIEATLLPDQVSLLLDQVAPGVYRGTFPLSEEGGYAVNVVDQSTGRSARYSFTIPYATEYQSIGRDEGELVRIAGATGGAVLPEGSLEDAVRRATADSPRPLFPGFLLLALALFLADLIFRKTRFRRLPTIRQ